MPVSKITSPITIRVDLCDRISTYTADIRAWSEQINRFGRPSHGIQHLDWDSENRVIVAGRYSERRDIIWIDVSDIAGDRRLWISPNSKSLASAYDGPKFSVSCDWRFEDREATRYETDSERAFHRYIADQCIQNNLSFWNAHVEFYGQEMWKHAVGMTPSDAADLLDTFIPTIEA